MKEQDRIIWGGWNKMGEVSLINNFEEYEGKFIQVCANDELYLWFGEGKLLHGHIFNNLLNALKITYNTFEESFNGEKIKIPVSQGKDYTLIGAGKFKKIDGKYFLSDRSWSYWVKPNKKHAKKMSKMTGLEFIIN